MDRPIVDDPAFDPDGHTTGRTEDDSEPLGAGLRNVAYGFAILIFLGAIIVGIAFCR